VVARAVDNEAPYFVDVVGQKLAEEFPGVTAPALERAAELDPLPQGQPHAFEAQRPAIAARGLAEAENELREARQARDENERLKRLLDFTKDVRYDSIPARVVARDPSVWFNSLIINRGTASGVDLDMPVVTPEGIVGRVVGVGPVSAQVMLITDDRAAAGAVVGQLGASNALGVVRGVGTQGLLEMRYVSGLEPVNLGDYVVTTGQDGIYPPGLNVGTVVQKTEGSATAPHTIYVKPGARLDSLEEVAVLQYRPPPRTAPERTLPNVDKGKK
jgi:rod shape-determining protein MreC